MTIKKLEIENKLSAALVALLQTAMGTIPVRAWYDESKDKTGRELLVRVAPGARIVGSTFWKVGCEIACGSYADDDENRAHLEADYAAALYFAHDPTLPASLATQSGLTIDGIIATTDPGDDDIEARMFSKVLRFNVFLTHAITAST
jgi:hypothetical protein